MAIDAAKLAVRISAEGVDQTSRQLRNLGLQIDSTGNQAKRSATGHDAMARSTQNAGRQSQQATGAVAGMASTLGRVNAGSVIAAAGIAGIGVAAAGAARGAIQAGIDFESAFAGVQKTVSATDAQFDVLERGIRDMALEVPIAATEIARIGEAAGQLGVAQGDILEFSRTMADLGVATNLTSEQAATALAQFSNITGAAISDVDNISSALVSLGNSSATTESQILDLALRLAGAGTTIGLTEEQILGISAALSSLGLRSESAGTSFSAVFLEIEKAVDMAGERLEIFSSIAGMTADQFTQVWSTAPDQALSAFIEGIAAFEQAGGNVSLLFEDLELGGIRVGDSLRRAAGGGDLLRSSMEQSTDAARENVALTEEAARRYETTASKLTLLGNQAKEAAISGFDILGPAIGASAEMLGEFLVSIPPAIEGLSDFIEVVQEMREADVSERTGLEGFLADIIELGSDANDVLNDLNAAINDLPTVVPLFDMKESNVSDVERNAEALLAAYEEVMGVSIVRTGDAVDSLIAWETHTGISFATVDDIYRRYIGTTKEVYEANQEMLSGLASGIDGSGQTGLDNLSTDLLAVQSTWTDTARLIRDEQQALGNGFQEFSTSAEAGFTQSTLSYSRFITAFSGNTETALSSFDALTQSIATGAIDFEQAASLYAHIPRDQLVPAVTEAAAELRGKLADATLSEMDARAIEGQVNALKQIFPDLVAEIDGTAQAIRNFGDVQDIFQGVVDVSRDRMSEWESNLSGAESALDILNQQIEDGIPLTKEQEEAYDTLTWATDRYAGGVEDSEQAVVDAEVAKAEYIRTLDELNRKLGDNEISQEDYNAAVGDALSKLDPAAGATYDLATAQEEVAGKLDDVIGRLRDLMVELGLIPVEHTISLNLDTSGARAAFDAFMSTVYGSNPTAEVAGVGFTQNAQGGVMPQGGWSWVGEEGKELLYIPPGGQVFNHHTSNEMAQRLPGFAQGTGSKIDLSDSDRQAIKILGEMDVVITPESMAQADAELAAMLDARAMAVELGLGEAIVAQLDEDIAAKQAELDLIGRIAGSAYGQGFLDELAQVDATEAMAGLLSDFSLEDIISGQAGTDLGQQLVDLLQLEKIALEMGDLDLAAQYREQADAVAAELERLGQVMGTEFVQGQIDGYNAEQVAAEWDARLADALAGPEFGANIQASIDEMNEKIDLGILMGAPMDVIQGWQEERDALVAEGQTYWADVVGAIAAGAFSPEEIAEFAEAGGDAFMDAMEETFSPEAIEGIVGSATDLIDSELDTIEGLLNQALQGEQPADSKQILGGLFGAVADGRLEMEKLFETLTDLPREELLPMLAQMENEFQDRWVNAIVNGNVEAAESYKELMDLIADTREEVAGTPAANAAGSQMIWRQMGMTKSEWLAAGSPTVAPPPQFADGGITPGGWAIVGERGPELAEFPAGTRIHPNHVTSPLLALMSDAGSGGVQNQDRMLDAIADRVVQRMGGTTLVNNNVFNVDGEPIVKSVNKTNTKNLATNMGPI